MPTNFPPQILHVNQTEAFRPCDIEMVTQLQLPGTGYHGLSLATLADIRNLTQ